MAVAVKLRTLISDIVIVIVQGVVFYVVCTMLVHLLNQQWNLFPSPKAQALLALGIVGLNSILIVYHRSRKRRLAYLASLRKSNRCIHCGYSLFGLASCVCPECGTAIPEPIEIGN